MKQKPIEVVALKVECKKCKKSERIDLIQDFDLEMDEFAELLDTKGWAVIGDESYCLQCKTTIQ